MNIHRLLNSNNIGILKRKIFRIRIIRYNNNKKKNNKKNKNEIRILKLCDCRKASKTFSIELKQVACSSANPSAKSRTLKRSR